MMAPRPWIAHIFKINGSPLLLQALSKKPSTGISSVTLGGHTTTPRDCLTSPRSQPGVQDFPHPWLLDSREKRDTVWSGTGWSRERVDKNCSTCPLPLSVGNPVWGPGDKEWGQSCSWWGDSGPRARKSLREILAQRFHFFLKLLTLLMKPSTWLGAAEQRGPAARLFLLPIFRKPQQPAQRPPQKCPNTTGPGQPHPFSR